MLNHWMQKQYLSICIPQPRRLGSTLFDELPENRGFCFTCFGEYPKQWGIRYNKFRRVCSIFRNEKYIDKKKSLNTLYRK